MNGVYALDRKRAAIIGPGGSLGVTLSASDGLCVFSAVATVSSYVAATPTSVITHGLVSPSSMGSGIHVGLNG